MRVVYRADCRAVGRRTTAAIERTGQSLMAQIALVFVFGFGSGVCALLVLWYTQVLQKNVGTFMAGMLRGAANARNIRYFLIQLDRLEASGDGFPPIGRVHVDAIGDAFEDIQGERILTASDAPVRGAVHWDQSVATDYTTAPGADLGSINRAGVPQSPPCPSPVPSSASAPDAGSRCSCNHVKAHHRHDGPCTWEVLDSFGRAMPCPCAAFNEVSQATLCSCGHSYASHTLEGDGGACAYSRGRPVSCDCKFFTPAVD